MDFGQALANLRTGRTMARPTWQDGCYLALANRAYKQVPFLAVHHAHAHTSEWQASNEDLLATDWHAADPAKPANPDPAPPGPKEPKEPKRAFRIDADGPRLSAEWDLPATARALWDRLRPARDDIAEVCIDVRDALMTDADLDAITRAILRAFGQGGQGAP